MPSHFVRDYWSESPCIISPLIQPYNPWSFNGFILKRKKFDSLYLIQWSVHSLSTNWGNCHCNQVEGCTERLAIIKFGKIFRSRGKERWSDFHFLPSHIYDAHHNSAILRGTGSVFRSCQSLTLLPLSLLSPPLLLLHWNYKNKRAPRDKYELSTHPKTTSSAIKMCGCKGQPCSLFPAFNWPLPQLPYRDAHGPPSSFHSLITFCLFPVFLNSNLAPPFDDKLASVTLLTVRVSVSTHVSVPTPNKYSEDYKKLSTRGASLPFLEQTRQCTPFTP